MERTAAGQPTTNTEDQRKLHAEINQIINQRFLLTTAAVTAFGVIAAWLIPKEPLKSGDNVSPIAYAGSILLLIVLLALFWYVHRLRAMSKTLAAYLIVTKQSKWEQDWAKYRKKGYFGYTEVQAIVFLILGVLAAAIPFLLYVAFDLKLDSMVGMGSTLVVGTVYIIIVVVLALKSHWFYDDEEARKRWKEIVDVRDTSGEIK